MSKTTYKTPKVEDLFDAGVHYGHQLRRWHPKMEPFIYSSKNKVHIIDLEQTEKKLKEACEVLFNVAKEGNTIIFVGTKRQATEIIRVEAERCGALYVTEKWLGGTITNFRVIKKNIDKYLKMLKDREQGVFEKYTKKERLMLDREIEKLQKYVGGIARLKGVPSMLFVVDVKKERTAVREATNAGVPVVGLIDTNSDPRKIKYPIPGNDDAIKSIALIVRTVADAIEAGYNEYEKAKDKVKKQEAEAAAAAQAHIDDLDETVPVRITTSEVETEETDVKLLQPEDIKKAEPEPEPIAEVIAKEDK